MNTRPLSLMATYLLQWILKQYRHHCLSVRVNYIFAYIPGFLKTGLAKILTYSTTWQFKTTKLIQRPIKSLYMTLGRTLMVPRSIPTSPNLKWRKFWNINSVSWLNKSFKPVSFQSKKFLSWVSCSERVQSAQSIRKKKITLRKDFRITHDDYILPKLGKNI